MRQVKKKKKRACHRVTSQENSTLPETQWRIPALVCACSDVDKQDSNQQRVRFTYC